MAVTAIKARQASPIPEAHQASPPSEASEHLYLMPGDNLEKRNPSDDFSSRKVIMGRSIKMEDFEYFQLQSLFDKAGIKIMGELNEPIYPALVKDFYSNLTADKISTSQSVNSPILTSSVMGIPMKLTEHLLCKFFVFPSKLPRIYDLKSYPRVEGWDYHEAIQRLTNNPNPPTTKSKLRARHLTPENRLLHLIC